MASLCVCVRMCERGGISPGWQWWFSHATHSWGCPSHDYSLNLHLPPHLAWFAMVVVLCWVVYSQWLLAHQTNIRISLGLYLMDHWAVSGFLVEILEGLHQHEVSWALVSLLSWIVLRFDGHKAHNSDVRTTSAKHCTTNAAVFTRLVVLACSSNMIEMQTDFSFSVLEKCLI